MSVKPTNIPKCHLRQSADSAGNFSRHGKLGEVTENIRTFALPFESQPYTFRMKYKYDSFNRMQQMTYPDGEIVCYGYNSGGMLNSITGSKNGLPYKYLDSVRYNEFELKSAMYYGNGTKTFYKYDILQRLDNLQSYTAATTTSPSEIMQDIYYKYDSVSNIIDITNYAGTLLNGLGGKYGNTYKYNNLYRLEYSEGTWYGNHPVGYKLNMEYTPNGRIVKKYLDADTYTQTPFSSSQSPVLYQNDYHYTNNNQPNTLTYIDNSPHQDFKWDVKGNLIFHYNGNVPFKRFLCWDEQNRLLGVKDDKFLSYYQYDANGDRIYKLTGEFARQNRNGEWRYYYYLKRPTLYASPYLVTNPQGYTKHYYAESERIASRMGGGGLYDIDRNDNPEMFVTHKEHSIQLFAEVMECLETQAEAQESPLKFLYEWKDIREEEKECYWYHPDHLGSSSWITFSDGKAVQHLHYLPWGENFVDQRSSTFDGVRYTFSAKEKDAETGYSYFGSRYYNSDLSIWLSVDPMADKYPSMSPYVYCANNPVKLVDPNGEEIVLETIYKKDANGNDTKEIERYNIRITGKILNSSGRKIDMEKAKEKIINQIETSFKGQTEDGIPVTTSADFEVANSYKEVKNNDHLFVLTNDCGSDNGHNFKGYTPKNGGMVALVDAALFKGPIDGTFGREGAIAAAHEMGHMFGLNHVGNPFNLMRTGFFHNRLNSFVSSRQLGNIIRNIQYKSPLIKKVNNR